MKKSIIISIKPEWVEKILNGKKTIEIRKSIPKCDLPIDLYIYCTKSDINLYKVIRENYVYFSGAVAEPFDTQIGFSLTKEKLDRKYRDNIDNGFSDIFTNILNGKIVAKFTLNKVDKYQVYDDYCKYGRWLKNDMFITNDKTIEQFFKKSCLSSKQLEDYVEITDFSFYQENVKPKYNICYAWHIDNLEIFDVPMELSEFYKHYFERDIDYLETVGCDNVSCPYAIENSILGDDGYCDFKQCPKLKIKKAPQSWCYGYKEN